MLVTRRGHRVKGMDWKKIKQKRYKKKCYLLTPPLTRAANCVKYRAYTAEPVVVAFRRLFVGKHRFLLQNLYVAWT